MNLSTAATTPVVNTKTVNGRRILRFENFEELLQEAARFDQEPHQQLGNWSAGQVMRYLAMAMNSSIDGVDFQLPLPLKWVMTVMFKRKFLEKGLPAGYPASKKMTPGPVSSAEAFTELQQAVSRCQQISDRVPHPAFGKIGKTGWDKFHLRHAELHLSYLVPHTDV